MSACEQKSLTKKQAKEKFCGCPNVRPASIMLKILPIILSRISQNLPIIILYSFDHYLLYSHQILLTILHAGNSGVK